MPKKKFAAEYKLLQQAQYFESGRLHILSDMGMGRLSEALYGNCHEYLVDTVRRGNSDFVRQRKWAVAALRRMLNADSPIGQLPVTEADAKPFCEVGKRQFMRKFKRTYKKKGPSYVKVHHVASLHSVTYGAKIALRVIRRMNKTKRSS